MKSVTIDRLKIADHVRWAEDQTKLEPSFLKEAALVAPHSEVFGSGHLYPAQFDLLFGLQMCNVPWAAFTPPSKQNLFFNRRFFSHRLFTTSFHHMNPSRLSTTKKEEQQDLQQIENIEEKGSPIQEKELAWHLVYDETEGARFEERRKSFDSSDNDSSQKKKNKTYIEEEIEENNVDRTILLLTEKISSLKKNPHQISALFERDKTAILNLLETIDWINGLLKQINGKKLQYQKG